MDAWVVPTPRSLNRENGSAEVEFPLGHDRPAPFHVASHVCLQDADHTLRMAAMGAKPTIPRGVSVVLIESERHFRLR